jgi:palmitoyl-protein thioesterase
MVAGVGDACANEGMAGFTQQLITALPGVYGTCIEYGAGTNSWFTTMSAQAKLVCDAVKADAKLAPGYNMVALSQGNLVARAVIEECGGPAVHNYVSLGGPHMGTMSFPQCETGVICDLLNTVIKFGVYSSFIQSFVGPANYFKDVMQYNNYLANSNFLPALNNEGATKSPAYKASLAALNSMTLVKFMNDTVIDPRDSEWMGFYAVNNKAVIQQMRDTDGYKADWLGLKTMDGAGKLSFVEQPGQHLHIDQALVTKTVLPALDNYL